MLKELLRETIDTDFGVFEFFIFENKYSGKRIWIYNKPSPAVNIVPMVRVQFGCAIGILSRSKSCDCNLQFEESLRKIQRYGKGALIYLADDDGRGIGLKKKIEFLKLQARINLPPIATAKHFNIPYEDLSSLITIPGILRKIKIISGIILLTNSPQKTDYLRSLGINVLQTKSLPINVNKLAKKAQIELSEKIKLLGHEIEN